MAKPTYRPHPFGGLTRIRRDGSQVIIRNAHDGGVRVVIVRPDPDNLGFGVITHSRRFV